MLYWSASKEGTLVTEIVENHLTEWWQKAVNFLQVFYDQSLITVGDVIRAT